MFHTPTVFILGAGASWHYGYPTGEDLVPQVVAAAQKLEQFFRYGAAQMSGNFPLFAIRNLEGDQRTIQPWLTAAEEAKDLASRLERGNPVLIDYFLAQNQKLHDIGRLAIALAILECEKAAFVARGNPNHIAQHKRRVQQGLASGPTPVVSAFSNDWVRFVLHSLTVKCEEPGDLKNNTVTFVTFNYDTSLERRLHDGLSSLEYFKESDITDFFARDRVIHIYGKVREQTGADWKPFETNLSMGAGFHESVATLNAIYKASTGIRTIDGDDKLKNADAIREAKVRIFGARDLYLLGYGFDAQNNARLGLDEVKPTGKFNRSIFFTNFRGLDRVSYAAGKALASNQYKFDDGKTHATTEGSDGAYHRKIDFRVSHKNVHDALAEDFQFNDAMS